jgi:hypothetical protein
MKNNLNQASVAAPVQRQMYSPVPYEIQEDDFLSGITPNELQDTWEDEE